MTVIRIRELGHQDQAFRVRVSFDDDAEYQVSVTDPADETTEENLAWYFEEHLRYPFLDKDKEEQAVQQIAEYGESLFLQVFGGEANHDYRNLRAESFDGCRIEISGSASLHRLHWEALRDPGLTTLLAVRMPVTRRVSDQPSKFALRKDLPTLNILVVTARPEGARDIGYRTISRPLIDVLRTAGLPVTVDLVRPGTWQALRDHLQSATKRHRSGWYHVIHFDLHGAFSEYGALAQGRRSGQLLFSPALISEFKGQRGFLFFETEKEQQAEPVLAEKVAALLEEHRIPVAILNACQSAMQSDSEAGLAQRLAEAGVPVALGMAYSVTVSAVERAMPVLYRRISDGDELTVAVTAARRELQEHRERRVYFGQELDLEDWLLPVMFGQRSLHIILQTMSDKEQRRFYERQAQIADEPSTEYGFVGRDLDIQSIEHRLLAKSDSNELLVRGMAGAGKSTLLVHLAWWWQRTGLVDQVFRFSYEDRAWTSSQIVREIRSVLMSPAEHADADILPEDAQAEQVAGLLRSARHLLILDNAESITAAPAAIPHSLDADEQQKLKRFLTRLRRGRTLVLLGSREAEKWLTAGQGPGIYELPGLDPQAASLLVDKILASYGAARWLAHDAERNALEDLVGLLGGYPLPLTVVLPTLASAPPSKVLEELRAGNVSADAAGIITKAIEYSYGKLDPALQNSLQLLAPFTAVIPLGPALDAYQDLVTQDDEVQGRGRIDLAAAVSQTTAVGLAVPHPNLSNIAQVQPVLPWFLRSRLASQPALRKSAAQAHYQLYCDALAPTLHQMTASGDPEMRLTGLTAAEADYANLRTALDYGLRTGQHIWPILSALDEYLDQTEHHELRRQLLDDAISAYSEPASSLQQRELAHLHDLAGHTALAQHRPGDAEPHYRVALELAQAAGDRRNEAVVWHELGRVAQEQRRFAEAEAADRQALEIFLELGDRHSAAGIYHSLGKAAQLQLRFAEAEAPYRQALDIFLELGDRHNVARTYHTLGVVAYGQRRFAEAEAAYRQALEIFLEFGDRHSAASIWHLLGVVAQERRRFAEAEAAYRQALDIYLEFEDRYQTAEVYHQLGRTMRELARFAEAEAANRRALDIYLEFGDRHSAADVYHTLGILAHRQGRFAEAETAYRQALDIYLEFGERHSAAGIYHNLGRATAGQGRFAEAEAAYRQALDICGDADPRAASSIATELGIVLAQSDRHDEAVQLLLYAATTWRQEAGQWDSTGLQFLRSERALLEPAEFAALVEANVHADIRQDLTDAIENVEIDASNGDTTAGGE